MKFNARFFIRKNFSRNFIYWNVWIVQKSDPTTVIKRDFSGFANESNYLSSYFDIGVIF
jgi:hypothetical protein